MKLELPKNNWISDAKIDFATGGVWHGAYMATLTFTGMSCPSREFLGEVLSTIAKAKLPQRKIVRITGLFSSTDQDLGILVKMLHDYGYVVQVVLTDIPDIAWLPYVTWVIYRSTLPFIPMSFDELWYEPPEIELIPEPMLPKQITDKATGIAHPQYLYLKRANSIQTITKFICESGRSWQLL